MRRLAIAFAASWLAITASVTVRAQPHAPVPRQRNRRSAFVTPPSWKSVEVGDFYFGKHEYSAALSRYREAVRTDPGYAPAYLGLGRVYEKLGEKRQALAAYQKYLDALPSDKDAARAKGTHRAIARLKRELGAGSN